MFSQISIGKLFLIILISIQFIAVGQSYIVDNFDDNVLTGWAMEGPYCTNSYAFTETNSELKVDYSIGQPECYDRFYKSFSTPINVTANPILCFKLRSPTTTFIKLQVELQDIFGNKTNSAPFIINNPTIAPNDAENLNGIYYEYCHDYNADWNQVWPSAAIVDKTQISRIVFYVNANNPAAGYYSAGSLWLDDITMRSANPLPSAGGTFYANGSAVNVSSSSSEFIYRLTDDNGLYQTATVFHKTAHDWTTNFDKTFRVYVGCFNATGADGISFFMMNDATKLNKVGGGGGGMGYGKGQRTYIEFPKSIAIEFDTWDNRGDGISNDVNSNTNDHLAINTDGFENTMVAGTKVNMGNIEDNAFHTLRVTYTAASNNINVYWDGASVLSTTYNVANYFNTGIAPLSTTAYWGITGSTGGSMNEQWFSFNNTTTPPYYNTLCNNIPLPVEIASFSGEVHGDDVILHWQTTSETNNSYFEIERSSSLQQWESLGTVMSAGINSGYAYSFTDHEAIKGVSYYRLKQVDRNGSSSMLGTLSVNSVTGNNHWVNVYPSPAKETISVDITGNESAHISIYDMLGNEVYNSHSFGTTTISCRELAEGFYTVKVTGASGEYHTKVLVAK